MNLSNETYERIERYLLQEMTPEEAQTFEADCQANPELAAALAQEKKIHLLIRIHNQSRVRKQIRSLDLVAARPRVSTKIIPFARMRRVTLLIGTIAAIFLVAIGFWWNGMGDFEDGSSIADNNDGMIATVLWRKRGFSDSLETLIKSKEWQLAISYYEDSPDSLQARSDYRVRAAEAYYENNKNNDYMQADSLARVVMGDDPSRARSSWQCKAKLIVVFCALRKEDPKEAQRIIAFHKGDSNKDGREDWKDGWECLEDEDYLQLEEINKNITKILK